MKKLAILLAPLFLLACKEQPGHLPSGGNFKLTNTPLGTVFSKTGSDLTNGSYVCGSAFYPDRGVVLKLFPEITATAATSGNDAGVDAGAGGVGFTAVRVKLQAQSGTAGKWNDVQTFDDQLGAQQVEQVIPDSTPVYSFPDAGITSPYGPLTASPAGYANGLRVCIKVTGTATASANVTVTAHVSW